MTEQVTQEKKYNLYFSALPSMQVVTTSGKRISFISGKYFTANAEEITYLDEMVSLGRDIYVDPKQLSLSESERDPMNALRAKFFKEFTEQQQAQLNPENERGSSEQGKLVASNTSDNAAVLAGGDATSLHAQVKKLIPGPTK